MIHHVRCLVVLVAFASALPPGAARAAERDNAADLAVCRARQIELRPKVDAYRGESRIKRLMEADLRRASREELEGDGDECIEALDHAAKLLAGDF